MNSCTNRKIITQGTSNVIILQLFNINHFYVPQSQLHDQKEGRLSLYFEGLLQRFNAHVNNTDQLVLDQGNALI